MKLRLPLLSLLLVATLAGSQSAPAADSLLDKARHAVREAGFAIERAAKNAGRSIKNFLVEHPELAIDIKKDETRPKEPAAVSVTGTLSKEGVECPALRGDDGALYTLTPKEIGGFTPGDRVHVEGKVAEVSTCMQGTTVTVATIVAAK